jgi:hypothetical protein
MAGSNDPNTTINYGGIVIIDTTRRTRLDELKTLGIRKPWDYIKTIQEIRDFLSEFQPLFEEIKNDPVSQDAYVNYTDRARPSHVPPFGEIYVWQKPTGAELSINITGTSTYTSEKRWNEITTRYRRITQKHLGDDAIPYIRNYAPGHYCEPHDDPANWCFELRAKFSTHIYYREYLPIRNAGRMLEQHITRR